MKRRLGIAIVVHNIDAAGGMERQALQLAKELVRRGARVWIVSTFRVPGVVLHLPRGVRAFERHGRLSIYRVPLCTAWKWRAFLTLFDLATAAVLAVHAAALDVIYAVQWTTAVQASFVARFLECPLFVKLACGGPNGDLAGVERSPDKARALSALASAERLVCISPQIAEEARALGLPESRFLAIPNGVDLARFSNARPATLPGPPGSKHVLYLGALRPEKHVPDLVRAFASGVARASPEAQLVIVGRGADEPAILAARRETGLEDRIHLLGQRTDVPELLAAARVFVLPSDSEGLSNALLEALAAGVPVVASDIDGNRAVVEHGKEALLFPLRDTAALGRTILSLLEDRSLADRLARAGRARATSYGLEEVASRYERAFREAARPLPSSLRLAGRYFSSFENRGVTLLAWLGFMFFFIRARAALARLVVGTKHLVGIEGDILKGVLSQGSKT